MKKNTKFPLTAYFQLLIADWYRLSSRNLPWRETKNAYKIWLSEIILQQTRVAQGLPYYLKFINNYPEIDDLANADEKEVLNLWQGLGYYSRARNMHKAAKIVTEQFNGEFPEEHDIILKLPGIGEYTAAAIASFAYDKAYPVLDGNVFRVLSRFYDIDLPMDSTEGKKFFKSLALENLNFKDPALHNQAIMEFGALQCVPSNPDCTVCPLNEKCLAYSNNTVNLRPIKSMKIKRSVRFFHYLIFTENNSIALHKREEKDIWQHLYQPILIETKDEFAPENLDFDFEYGKTYKHLLTHQTIFAKFYKAGNLADYKNYEMVDIQNLDDFPLPILIDNFFKEYKIY